MQSVWHELRPNSSNTSAHGHFLPTLSVSNEFGADLPCSEREPVANAANVDNVTRAHQVLFDLLTEVPDTETQVVGGGGTFDVPDTGHQFAVATGSATRMHQCPEQLVRPFVPIVDTRFLAV
jgi:hypothetical protein